MDIKQYVIEKARKAKAASRQLANISTEIKNNALLKMAASLEHQEVMRRDFIAIIVANLASFGFGEVMNAWGWFGLLG